MKKTVIVAACFLGAFNMVAAQSAKTDYKIAKKIHLDGDAGWDYLTMDEATGRLFVSHGTMVQVVDVKTAKVLGAISDLKGVHGIAIANDLDKGFISNGRDSSVTIFNLKTLATIGKVKVTGSNPDAILYDIFSHKVFTFNGRSNDATVLDAKTNKVIKTIKLAGKPEFSVTDGKGKIYVNIEDKSLICEINATTLKVEQSWPIAPGEEPSGLALDNVNHRLFSVCDNKTMVVVNAENGKVINSLPIGEHVDGVSFDNKLKRAYSANGDGTLTVVQEEDANTFKILENVSTQKGARTIAIDNSTHHVYLPTAEYGAAPAATKENPRPRPTINPNTFSILDVEVVK
jgi:YVTN family beta-propeller protein